MHSFSPNKGYTTVYRSFQKSGTLMVRHLDPLGIGVESARRMNRKSRAFGCSTVLRLCGSRRREQYTRTVVGAPLCNPEVEPHVHPQDVFFGFGRANQDHIGRAPKWYLNMALLSILVTNGEPRQEGSCPGQ